MLWRRNNSKAEESRRRGAQKGKRSSRKDDEAVVKHSVWEPNATNQSLLGPAAGLSGDISELASRAKGWWDSTAPIGSISSHTVIEEASPFLATFGGSLAVHYAVLQGCQLVSGSFLRVSCATPVLSTLVGGSAVALASVASGCFSRAVQQPLSLGSWEKGRRQTKERGASKRNTLWNAVTSTTTGRDILLDAGLGLVCFSAFGGRLRSVLPSDVRFPGANANTSMPAVGASYATKFQRTELLRMLRLHGCHHCGKKSGPVIADHMPPNKFVENMKERRRDIFSVLAKMRWNGKVTQRFYPQCQGCSQKQAVAVKTNRKSLVLHLGGWSPYYFAGPLVAGRSYQGGNVNNKRNIHGNIKAVNKHVRDQMRSLESYWKNF